MDHLYPIVRRQRHPLEIPVVAPAAPTNPKEEPAVPMVEMPVPTKPKKTHVKSAD